MTSGADGWEDGDRGKKEAVGAAIESAPGQQLNAGWHEKETVALERRHDVQCRGKRRRKRRGGPGSRKTAGTWGGKGNLDHSREEREEAGETERVRNMTRERSCTTGGTREVEWTIELGGEAGEEVKMKRRTMGNVSGEKERETEREERKERGGERGEERRKGRPRRRTSSSR